MQYEFPKSSKITIREDRAIGGSSQMRGAHVDALGFNILFILERDPQLALDILKLYRRAADLKPESPKATDGQMMDLGEQIEEVKKMLANRVV